jgi:hypothetical protein
LESDADEELLLFIPFTANIKLKSFTLIGGENGKGPKKVKMYFF